ncbi:MAG: hypothetical protein AVO35_11320 [Candidatus Aegiribacteria sp. MLS_C]|nr:MAG: hypothetical protein AVO35_11320 [Candidatus Aegiribacteria sp. MLS_C]
MKKWPLLAFLLIALPAGASAGTVDEVRAFYNEVKEDLDGYYLTEVVVNRDYLMYPALGNYQETLRFYWRSEAGFDRLVLATWSSEWAAHTEYGEVLYRVDEVNEGDPEVVAFQFVAFDNYDEYGAESRWYYDEGLLVEASGISRSPEGEVRFVPEAGEERSYGHNHEELLEMFISIHH